ncbi:MAG TPA: TolC family protein [Saprospiraceae bacterium]|nr:TolC family protein [Saprospiraceae bacterium]
MLPLFLLSQYLYGQEPTPQPSTPNPLLTPEEAVRIALENNYDIRLSQADAEIAKLNNIKANAGMLPTVDFVAGDNIGLNAYQHQNLADGRSIEAYGAFTNSASAGVQLNWTLFDGKRMFIAKKRLEEVEALGQLNLQNQVQQTTAAVLQTYYEIVRTRLNERALAEVITLNEERLRIAEARLAAGFAAQTDALQARIDLNQRRTDLLNQQIQTDASKRALNSLLVRPPATPFDVDETLVNTYAPSRDTLIAKITAQNPTLLSLRKNAEVSALVVDENRTLNKPRIQGISQFNLQRTDNTSGFLLNNTVGGLIIGANLSIPLYTGGNIQRQIEVARVQALQSNLLVEAQLLSVETDLDNQLAFFNANQQVLQLEEENVVNARESLKVSTERFRLGQTNALEVQTSQNTLEQALARRNIVRYNLKSAEIQLRLLAGEL